MKTPLLNDCQISQNDQAPVVQKVDSAILSIANFLILLTLHSAMNLVH